MAHTIYNLFNRKATPQSMPIPGSTQVANSAGGFAWQLDPWKRLMRFLVLGTEGGTFYISEQALTRDNAQNALRVLAEDGPRFVRTVVDVSENGRAYKNDPALFALALAAAAEDAETRRMALEALPRVARTGTHLFHFASYVDGLRGWGRGLRQAVSNWYAGKNDEQLAFQLAKYQSRDGWSHRDLLRLAHPLPEGEARKALFRWAVGAEDVAIESLTGLVAGLEQLQRAQSEAEVIQLIREYKAPREVVPTQYLTSAAVWEALLPSLGITALLRNLGNLSKVGLLAEGAGIAREVVGRMTDRATLRRGRVHPLQVLAALVTYQQGHGMRGSGQWAVAPEVVEALNTAFGLAFENVVPTGKRLYLGLDVSSSMSWGMVSGIPGLAPREASAALAMITVNTEEKVIIRGFSTNMIPLRIKAGQSLAQAVAAVSNLPFGGTDVAQPMLDALKHDLAVDAFVVYTDSETWAGKIHPVQALRDYREKTGIPARLVVVGMTSNGFTIADPEDAGMLDVVGFSTSTPSAIADFIADRLGAGEGGAEE
ncbi:MAG: TROVE domain-containing protein [Anaerolineaceae bacterium]|nr:TROVE domain-containing protein [Anaerolineaceae bacterium]